MATYEFDGPGALGWYRSAAPTQQQLQLAAQASAAYNFQVDARLYQLFNHFVERTDDASLASRYGGGPW